MPHNIAYRGDFCYNYTINNTHMENKNTGNAPELRRGEKNVSSKIKKTFNEEAKNSLKKDTGEEAVSQNRAVFFWETPEYAHHEKSNKWYMVAGGILLFFVLIGIFTGSASMAIAFLLLGGVYYISHQKKPKHIHVIISELGINFGHRYYPYNIIDSFWVLYQPPHLTTLNLKLNKGAMRVISIELSKEISPGDLRDYLLTQVPEQEGKEEGFIDAISRKFKL